MRTLNQSSVESLDMISMGSLSRKEPADWCASLVCLAPKLSSRGALPRGFHDYAQKISSPDAELMLTKPSYGAWRVSQHQFGRIVVRSGVTGGATIYDGTAQSGSFEFFMQDTDEMHPVRLNGRLVADGAVAALAPGKPIVLACPGSYKWMSLSVSQQALREAGFTQARIHQLEGGHYIINSSGAAALQLSMAEAIEFARKEPVSSKLDRFRAVECGLLESLLVALGANGDVTNHATSRIGNSSLDRINRRALDLIRSRDELDLNVETLCRAIDVAERRLLRAFRRYFDIGPTQYMKLRRLNRMHNELQTLGCAETTVTGVMTNCGVTEFGRFAGAYRALFGESPSETLKGKLAAIDRLQGGAGTAARRRTNVASAPDPRRFQETVQRHAMV